MKIIGFCILVFCFCSCYSTTVYSPSIDRTTTVKAKNELIGGIGFGFSKHVKGVNAHVQYSPLNNLGIQANCKYGKLYNTVGFAVGRYSQSIIKEKGLALYLDAYLGYNYYRIKGRALSGYHAISNKHFGYEFDFDYQYQVFSFQSGCHFISDKITLDVVVRPSLIDILSVEIFGDYLPSHQQHLAPLNDDPFFLTDVSSKISFGKEKVKMYAAFSIALLNRKKLNAFMDPLTGGVGMNLYFSRF